MPVPVPVPNNERNVDEETVPILLNPSPLKRSSEDAATTTPCHVAVGDWAVVVAVDSVGSAASTSAPATTSASRQPRVIIERTSCIM